MRRDKASLQLRTPESVSGQATRKELLSGRDVADTLFRQSRVIFTLCTILTLAIGGYFWISPRMYESEMTILVKNTRADLVVTPRGPATAFAPPGITHRQIGSDI